MSPKISVCIITRNEEFNIEFCLNSVLPIAYEIIVLDTGSTDRTKEICKEFNSPLNPLSNPDGLKRGLEVVSFSPSLPTLKPGEKGPGDKLKLFETVWEDDFSKARNQCISYATGDWILSIDADEILSEYSQKNMVPLLENREKEEQKPDIYNFNIIQPVSVNLPSFYRAALFKADLKINFIRPLHEHPDVTNRNLHIVNCPLFTINQLNKFQSKEEFKKKEEYYVQLLKKIISENPDKSDNYFYYKHLGDSYHNLEQFENSLANYYQSYDIYHEYSLERKDREFFNNLLINIIRKLLYYFDRRQEALKFIEELLAVSDSTDGYSFLAYYRETEGKYQEALDIYQFTFDLLTKKDPYGLNRDFYNYIKEQIDNCNEKLEKSE